MDWLPSVLALVVVISIYSLRVIIFGGFVASLLEDVLENAIGNEIDIEIEEVSGTVVRGLELKGLETIKPAQDGVIREITVDRLSLSYRLVDILAFRPISSIFGVEFSSPGFDTEWIFASPPGFADMVLNIHKTVPKRFFAFLRGSIVLQSGETRIRVSTQAEFGQNDGYLAKLFIPQFSIENDGTEVVSQTETGPIELGLKAKGQELRLSSLDANDESRLRLDLELAAEHFRRKSRMTRASLMFEGPCLDFNAAADKEKAELNLRLQDGKTASRILRLITADKSSSTSGLELDASADLIEVQEEGGETVYENPSIVNALFTEPSSIPAISYMQADLDSKNWKLPSVVLKQLSLSANWQKDKLSLESLQARGNLEGLDFTDTSSRTRELSVELDAFRWNTNTNTFQLEQLKAEGGSAVLQSSGSISLTGDAAAVENLRGELSGQLIIENPKRVMRLIKDTELLESIPLDFSPQAEAEIQFTLKSRQADQESSTASSAPLTTSKSPRSITFLPHISLDLRAGFYNFEAAGFSFDSAELEASLNKEVITLERFRVTRKESSLRLGGTAYLDGLRLENYQLRLVSNNLSAWNDVLSQLQINATGTPTTAQIVSADINITKPDDFRISLTDPMDIRWTKDTISIGSFTFESELGTLNGFAELREERISAELQAHGLPLKSFIAPCDSELAQSFRGTLTMSISATGPLSKPALELSLQGNNILVNNDEGFLLIVMRQGADAVIIENIDLELGELGSIQGNGLLPFIFGTEGMHTGDLGNTRLNLAARLSRPLRFIEGFKLEPFKSSDLSLDANLTQKGGTIRIAMHNLSQEADMVIAGVRPISNLIMELETDDLFQNRIDFKGSLAADWSPLMDFTAALRSPVQSFDEPIIEEGVTPTRLHSTEPSSSPTKPDFEIDGNINLPLLRFSNLLPSISLLGGDLKGTFNTAGVFTELIDNVKGNFQINNAFIKITPTVPTVSRLKGNIAVNNRKITIEGVQGIMGDGLFELNGEVQIPEKEPIRMNVQADGENILLARTPDLMVGGDIDVNLNAAEGSGRVEGELMLGNVSYTQPIQLFSLGGPAAAPASDFELFSIEAPWARSVSLNLRVTADQTIMVDNNLFEGSLSADLLMHGTASLPRLEGRVSSSSGEIILPTAALDIRQLEVLFPQNASFSPEITATAQTSIQGYDMSVSVEGQIPNVELSIFSSPPLAKDQALLLLTTGLTTSELTFRSGTGGTLRAVGSVLGRSFLSQISKSLSPDENGPFERLDFIIEQDESSETIGSLQIEYQILKNRQLFLRFEREAEEDYSISLAWKVWVD